MYKKISLALTVLSFSAAAFAGHPGDTVIAPVGVNLLAPNNAGVWSLGLEALYMEPTNADFQYAQLTQTGNTGTTSSTNKSVNPGHDWGGTIDIAYLFPGKARDIKFSYTHLKMNNNSGNVTANDNPNAAIVSPFNVNFNGAATIANAWGESDYNYNSADMLLGQWIRVGHRLDLHPFVGLRWAKIDVDDKATYDTNTTGAFGYGKLDSDFEGIGPRVGLDASVHVGSGISFIGTVGASLLIGGLDGKAQNITLVNNTLTEVGNSVYKLDEGTQVVPELDARLGVNYTYHFNPGAALGLELGYQAVNYFDVAYKDYNDNVTPNTVNNSEDFGYKGPFFRAQLSVV